MGREKFYMGQESLIRWDKRRRFDGTGEVDITSKQDEFLATNVPFLFVCRQLLSEF
jgi:hypothetical protein